MKKELARQLTNADKVIFMISTGMATDAERSRVNLSDLKIPDDSINVIQKSIDFIESNPDGQSNMVLSNGMILWVTAK